MRWVLSLLGTPIAKTNAAYPDGYKWIEQNNRNTSLNVKKSEIYYGRQF